MSPWVHVSVSFWIVEGGYQFHVCAQASCGLPWNIIKCENRKSYFTSILLCAFLLIKND